MATPAPVIRDIAAADEAAWRRLWAGYIAFYEASVPEAVTAATFARLLDPASPIGGRVAVVEGRLAGFAHRILHDGTWTTKPVCYLEDLFVDPSIRGAGLGRALLDDLMATARDRGWSQVYWVTRTGNATARRLYDRYTGADDFVRYLVETGPPA